MNLHNNLLNYCIVCCDVLEKKKKKKKKTWRWSHVFQLTLNIEEKDDIAPILDSTQYTFCAPVGSTKTTFPVTAFDNDVLPEHKVRLQLQGETQCFHISLVSLTLLKVYYRKTPKYSDTRKIYCNNPKIWLIWIFHWKMCPNDADGMANSVDPDQTTTLGAVWFESTVCSDPSVRKFKNITVHYASCSFGLDYGIPHGT